MANYHPRLYVWLCENFAAQPQKAQLLQSFLGTSGFTNESIASCDLEKVHIFIINEVEGQQITGEQSPEKILAAMARRYPLSATVLTLGSKGVMFCKDGEIISQDSCKVNAVDTTAAGDTFTGYFLQTFFEASCTVRDALLIATKAAALAVTRKGAVPSIPWKTEVEESVD